MFNQKLGEKQAMEKKAKLKEEQINSIRDEYMANWGKSNPDFPNSDLYWSGVNDGMHYLAKNYLKEAEQKEESKLEFEIDFDGNVNTRFIVENNKIKIVGAMNGYGNAIDESKIIISDFSPALTPLEDITEEDYIEIGKIVGWFKEDYIDGESQVLRLAKNYIDEIFTTPFSKNPVTIITIYQFIITIYQFLQSRNYKLPKYYQDESRMGKPRSSTN
jgi:hypothetical protein